MAYTPTEWVSGTIISASKLNNIERGVESVNSEYTPTTWAEGDTVTAAKLNKIEQGIADASGGGSSDFSTATVTITSNTENDFELWANNVDGANMYSDIVSDDIDGSADFEIVLYKGRGLVWPKNYHNFIISSVSGDITVSENMATVTGNGTITITDA